MRLENDNGKVLRLDNLLAELRSFSSHEKIEFLASKGLGDAEDLRTGEHRPPLIIPKRFYEHASGLLREIDIVTQSLNQQLSYAEGVSSHERRDSSSLDLGEIFLEREEFPIVRGSLRLVQHRPIISSVSVITAQFLQRVDKRHVVIRENHGDWGYHFHYCDAKKKRSDTIFSFREKLNKNGNKVVFHEGHAEGKSAFHARVDLWGRKKKESAYSACLIGVGKFTLADFKKPGASAETLWPVP